MTELLMKQSEVAGRVLFSMVREEFARAIEGELATMRQAMIAKMDERLADFRKKILSNIRVQHSNDVVGNAVIVQFVCPMDQLRKECGL